MSSPWEGVQKLARQRQSDAGKVYGRGKPKASVTRDKSYPVTVRQTLSKAFHVSEGMMSYAKQLKSLDEEISERVGKGELTTAQAFRELEVRGIEVPEKFRTDVASRENKLTQDFLRAAIRLHEEFDCSFESLAWAIQDEDFRERARPTRKKRTA